MEMHPLRPFTFRLKTVAGRMGRISRRTAAAAIVAANLSSAIGFAATATAAVSVTNRDDAEHKITLIEGETKKDHLLKPNQVLTGVCAAGCVLRLNDSDDDEYQLEANDVVSIEDGYLYYDTPETPDEAAPGAKSGEKKQ